MKKLNAEALIKIIILFGYSIFSINSIRTGKIKLYVHPRIVPFIIFGIIVMIIIGMISVKDLCSAYKRKVRFSKYLIYIIPLIMAFSIKAKAIDSSMIRNKSITINQNTNSMASASKTQNIDYSSISPSEGKKLNIEGNTIIVNDENFVFSLDELNENIKKYEKMKIKITGFVYKDKSFKENEFVAARFMMTCCTADMQVVGLMCNFQNTKALNNDTWVEITGKLEKSDYQGQVSACIKVDSIKKISKPDNQYVYPFVNK
ncbi:MAG: TIGR03943 family protein [Clostridiaceae bacterium]